MSSHCRLWQTAHLAATRQFCHRTQTAPPTTDGYCCGTNKATAAVTTDVDDDLTVIFDVRNWPGGDGGGGGGGGGGGALGGGGGSLLRGGENGGEAARQRAGPDVAIRTQTQSLEGVAAVGKGGESLGRATRRESALSILNYLACVGEKRGGGGGLQAEPHLERLSLERRNLRLFGRERRRQYLHASLRLLRLPLRRVTCRNRSTVRLVCGLLLLLLGSSHHRQPVPLLELGGGFVQLGLGGVDLVCQLARHAPLKLLHLRLQIRLLLHPNRKLRLQPRSLLQHLLPFLTTRLSRLRCLLCHLLKELTLVSPHSEPRLQLLASQTPGLALNRSNLSLGNRTLHFREPSRLRRRRNRGFRSRGRPQAAQRRCPCRADIGPEGERGRRERHGSAHKAEEEGN
mmetsp:Transcript_12656/g.24599  ORF Transcript_12656/g.24599 Transcript_12656/m.24599 type:complete len:400 (+) Transcript_12656:357-1556(+)